MKLKSLLFLVLLMGTFAFAQKETVKDTVYPLVTLRQINEVPDSIAAGWPPSPLTGQTVRVVGQVVARPVIGGVVPGQGNRNPVLWFGSKWGTYIQGNPYELWSGINIYGGADTTTPAAQGTLLDLCDTAATYEFTGTVTMFGQTPELVLVTSPQPIPVTLVSIQSKRPDPMRLTLDSAYLPDGTTFNHNLRKYLGMYVELVADDAHPLIVSDVITGTGSSAGGFKLNDGNGHSMLVYAQSRYFKTASGVYRERPNYNPPPAGSYLQSIRGILEVYNNQWEVTPVYPQDLGNVLVSPPSISSVKRNIGVVPKNTPVVVTCTAKALTGATVTAVKLFKRVNFGALDSLVMTKGSGADSTTYTTTIPAVNSDSAFVDYYVKAYDSNGLTTTSPFNLSNSRFSYFVLNRPLTIQDVRYSPFGSAYSSYNGYQVSVSGVVISDTSDLPGNHGSNPFRVYIQNGEGPWSGILLGTSGAVGPQVTALKRGDKVNVTGYVNLTSLGNRLDTLSVLTVVSSNNPLPAPKLLPIDSVGTSVLGTLSAEPWNGTLVKYQNVTIDSANADGTSNFGESFGKNDNGTKHTRLIWSDGNTSFNVGATAVKVKKGDKFGEIIGVLGLTHANYKLAPRKDSDISGYIPVAVKNEETLPQEYVLNQNYPNPFNPSTIISYALPKSGNVSLKIFDVLGQEVKTLVNQFQEVGNHQVNFNASSLNSGIYFYSIKVDNFVQVKKMMLIK